MKTVRKFSEEDRAETKNVLTEAKKSISFISKRMKMAEPHFFFFGFTSFRSFLPKLLNQDLFLGQRFRSRCRIFARLFPTFPIYEDLGSHFCRLRAVLYRELPHCGTVALPHYCLGSKFFCPVQVSN